MAGFGKIVFASIVGLVAFALASGAASAAPPCQGAQVSGYFDFASDVDEIGTGHAAVVNANFDITELRSCMDGDDIVLGMNVAGTIVTNSAEPEYMISLDGPGFSQENFFYANGSAWYLDSSFDEVSLVNETQGGWLTIRLNKSLYDSQTSGWMVWGHAGTDVDADDYFDYLDEATIDIEFDVDVSTEVSPFNSPAVTISSVVVWKEGSGYHVEVNGTTSGGVDQLQVAMGVKLIASSVSPTWLFSDTFWLEQNLSEGDANVVVERVGGTWASWRFTRNYTEADIKGIFSSLWTISEAKVEVRAMSQNGHWGHANRTFQPTTVSQAPGGGGGGGGGTGGSSSLLLVLVAVVAAAAICGVLFMRKRNKGALPPGGTPPAVPPPGAPPR